MSESVLDENVRLKRKVAELEWELESGSANAGAMGKRAGERIADLQAQLEGSRADVERLREGRDTANLNMACVKRYVEGLESLFGGAEVMALWLTHDKNEGRVQSAYDWLKRREIVQSINMADEHKEGE
jgi:hypothetical protein